MVPDVATDSLQLDLKPTSLTFKGRSTSKNTTYHLELEFFSEIDVENSKTNQTARDIEMILRKKELKEEYWPRLLKESKRVHYLKTDFDKVSNKNPARCPSINSLKKHATLSICTLLQSHRAEKSPTLFAHELTVLTTLYSGSMRTNKTLLPTRLMTRELAPAGCPEWAEATVASAGLTSPSSAEELAAWAAWGAWKT